MRNTLLLPLCLVLGGAWCASSTVQAAKIEADPGKTYTITKKHGPWLIMCASFSAGLKGEEAQQLKNAEKAARDLVLELRRMGIPAYVYAQQGQLGAVNSFNRMGQPTKKFVAEHRNQIVVLAGNYPSSEDSTAQSTLKYVKRLQPESLANGVFQPTPGRPGPLSRAFLTRNPLLLEEDPEQQRYQDPMLKQINARGDYNLLENKGKYTVVVASFYGRAQTHIMNPAKKEEPAKFLAFDRKLQEGDVLGAAALNSWELVQAMRAQGIDAYVFHERYRSVVTVGAFDSKDDPRIRALVEKFRAKVKRNPATGQDVLVAEAIQIKDTTARGQPLRNWAMDPHPQLIPVPKLH